MIVDHLFPVFAMIVAGRLLRRAHVTTEQFLAVSDRLVYYIFFPALLFWKIGSAPLDLAANAGLYKAAICAVAAVWALSTAFIVLARVTPFQAGSFSQSCYRFNTYIGVAIVLSAFGEQGIRLFGVLIGIVIPVINLLAVSTLTWFGSSSRHGTQRLRQTLKALATNPLILGCAGGILWAATINRFPVFVDNTLKLASYVTLPLALLSIGGALTLRGLRRHLGLAVAAAVFKLLLLPALGFAFLKWFQVQGLAFEVGMVYFCLPTSTALYVLSSQLNSDTELASAAIAVSTAVSFFSLSAALVL